MTMNRWKFAATPFVIFGLASPMLVNCDAIKGAASAMGAGCDEFNTGNFAELKFQGMAPQVEGKIKGFLSASYDLKKILVDMETGLMASCGKLGKDIGVTDEEMKAEAGGGKGAEKICGAVAAKISGMLKGNASGKLSLEIGAPKCSVDVQAMTKCFGECGGVVKGGELKASCSGGEISGKCDAECKGECSVEAGASCTGTCSAECSGSCDAGFSGTCGGKCDGKCDGKDSKNKACKGKCDGKCDASAKGSCTGTCGGKCSGGCKAKAGAKCEGSCSGGCSVEMKAPKCSGDFKPPSVSVDCQLSCAAKGLAYTTCEAPSLKVKIDGKANADLEKLVAALQADLPEILKIQLGVAKKIGVAGAAVAKAGVDVKAALNPSMGLKAAGCIAAGLEASVSASMSIDVNIKASASVGGSAKGGT